MKKKIISFTVIFFILFGLIWLKNNVNPSFHNLANKKDDKLDILLVANDLAQSGAQIMLFNLADVLLKNDYSVYLYSYEDGDMHKKFNKRGVKVIVSKKYKRNHDFSKIVQQFDLVITNDLWTSASYMSSNEYVPAIWWVHAIPEYDKTTMDMFEMIYQNDHNLFPPYIYTLSKAQNIVSVSSLLSESIKKFNSNKINLIYNIIEEKNILYKNKIDDNVIRFSLISRLVKDKGIDVLIEAISLLPEEYNNKAIFNIVGGQSDDFINDLKLQTTVFENIIWTGEVQNKNMKDIYAQTDVILHPSRKDASPLVILEAAANNIPSVITDNVGSTHIIKDKESGFVIPVDNAEALKEKIMWFIDNPEQIEIMGEKANQYYRETSSKEVFEKKWLELIKDVLSKEKNKD